MESKRRLCGERGSVEDFLKKVVKYYETTILKKGGKTDVSKNLWFAHWVHCALPMAEQG